MNNYIFPFSAVILYFACATLLFFYTQKTGTNSAENTGLLSKKPILVIGFAGLILHSLALYSSMVTPAGINFGFYNTMSLVSVSITLLTLIAVWQYPVEILAIILLPIATVAMMFGFNNETDHILDTNSSNALVFHILTSIIAYSLLALAALQAILLSIQSKLLHAHQPGGILKLMPSLKSMEILLFEVIVVGFLTLTVSLATGLFFLENMFAQHLAHKTILSILTWFVFLTLLIGHWKLGWRGRTAVRWTLGGFASLMLAYFGSKFVLEVILA